MERVEKRIRDEGYEETRERPERYRKNDEGWEGLRGEEGR